MKYHAVLLASLIALPSVFSSCYANEAPAQPEAANAVPEIQMPSAAETTNASPESQKPGASATVNDNTGVQKPSAAETAKDSPEFQKPSEAEAIEAAIKFLNQDGKKTIQKSEFLAWGTYSEKQVYWPMKLRLTYKIKGSDAIRQSDYAVKISRDSDGKLKAAQYYAWRTDFK
jgi:hypothetical protein